MKKTVKAMALAVAMLIACMALSACGNGGSAQSGPNHKVTNANGLVLIEDDAIDANNAEAQAKIEQYMKDNDFESVASAMSSDMYTATIFAQGNAVVFEMTVTIDLTDNQKETLVNTANAFKDSMKESVVEAQADTGVSDMVIVAAYVDKSGEVIAAVVTTGK